MTISRFFAASFASLLLASPVLAEEIGSVDTVFKMFGPDHKIVVEAFDDPDVKKCNLLYQPGENRRD
ncbi:CreA family protein [Pantoea tagorei]